MRYIPEVARALALARFARALSWLPTPPELCGVAIHHLTPRMRLDLELSGNGFVLLREARQHDVFAFLWRLHPDYAPALRPEYLRPAKGRRQATAARLALAFGSRRTAAVYAALKLQVAGHDFAQAREAIRQYCAGVNRDRSAIVTLEKDADAETATRLLPLPESHWLDDLMAFFGEKFPGWTADRLMDAPMARLYQIRRAWAIGHGASVVDEAHEIATDFARRNLAEHGALIRQRAAGG